MLRDDNKLFHTNVQAAAFTPDGDRLVVGISDYYRVLSWSDGGTLNRFLGDDHIHGVGVHPNGTTLVLTGNSQSATFVTIVEIDEQLTPPAGSGVMFDPGWDEHRLQWSEFEQQWEEHTILLESDLTSGAVFSPNGRFIAISHWNPVLYCYPERELWCAFDEHGSRIPKPRDEYGIARSRTWSRPVFTPHGNDMLCASPEGIIFRWDVNSGTLLDRMEAHKGRVFDIALSPNGKTLASCGADKMLKLWHLND